MSRGRTCLTGDISLRAVAGRNWRLMAARLLRPLLMVEREPLNTPAMKRPGRPGTSPATWRTWRGSIWSRFLTL